ncbi:MAG: DUF4351 domain-containing protein, partial [Desulfococcaceae bacterium]
RLGDENARREMMTIAERHEREARESEARELLFVLLQSKFGTIPESLEKRVRSASLSNVRACTQAFVKFQSLEDAERWWN